MAVDSAYDDVQAMSASPPAPAVNHLPAPGLEAGDNTEGYEVMYSAPRSVEVRAEASLPELHNTVTYNPPEQEMVELMSNENWHTILSMCRSCHLMQLVISCTLFAY